MLLVSSKTGEVFAAWTGPRMPIGTTKKGKIQFLGDRRFGPEFEFLALMCLVTDKERVRRNRARY